MKAVLFALLVLAGLDVGLYHAAHLRGVGRALAGVGASVGEWVYTPG